MIIKDLDGVKNMKPILTLEKPHIQKIVPMKTLKKKNPQDVYIEKLINDHTTLQICKLPFFITIKQWIEKGYFEPEKLVEVVIDICKMGRKEMSIFQKYNFQNVTRIILSNNNNLNHIAIKQFGKANWRNLKNIYITYNYISKNGVKQICKMDLPLLQYLWLRFCSIQSSSYKILVKNNFPSLKKMGLTQNYMHLDDVHILLEHKKQQQKTCLLRQMSTISKLQTCISIMSSKNNLQYCKNNNVTAFDYFYAQFPDITFQFND